MALRVISQGSEDFRQIPSRRLVDENVVDFVEQIDKVTMMPVDFVYPDRITGAPGDNVHFRYARFETIFSRLLLMVSKVVV